MTWQPLVESQPMRNGKPAKIAPDETLWSNDQYVVHRRQIPSKNDDGTYMVHLSIRRQDRKPCESWRDFQRIKNQLAGPEWEAIEIYPAESRKVDSSNQYHLWCLSFRIALGFDERLVMDEAESAELSPGSVQEPFEPVDLQYGGTSDPNVQKRHIDDYQALIDGGGRHD